MILQRFVFVQSEFSEPVGVGDLRQSWLTNGLG